jgi:tripartite-type tricarboxylate transporter receptor subunit TctC
MKTRRLRSLALLAGVTLLFSAPAPAQQWPSKPVRLIVPFATGGGTDIQARILSDVLRRLSGQNFLTDNRAGASGLIGAQLAVQAPPDGHTVLFSTASLAVNATLSAKTIKFDPLNDLVPSTWISSTPLVLCVHPSVPAKSVKDLIGLAKKLPGKLNNAVNLSGSTSHLAGEMFQNMTGTKALIIAYSGGGPAMASLMTGETDFLFATGPVASNALKIGRIKAIAVTTAKPSSAFPGLPAINTAVPGLVVDNWYGMFFPKGTPQPIVNQLSELMKKALSDPKIAAFYKQEGLDAVASTPDVFRKVFADDIAKYAKVIKDANIPTR